MQSCYLRQINAAIVRQDPVSVNHRVAAWLSSYFDILFAMNGQFHPGEKRPLIYAEELTNLPSGADGVRAYVQRGELVVESMLTSQDAARARIKDRSKLRKS